MVAIPGLIGVALVGLKRAWPSLPRSRRRLIAALVLTGQAAFFVAGLGVLRHFNGISAERKARVERLLAEVPTDSVFIGGAYTPALEFYRQSGIRPHWLVIRSGWEWNAAALPAPITAALNAHRPVFVIHDAQVWDYLRTEWNDVQALRRRFRFEEVDAGMEQIERGVPP